MATHYRPEGYSTVTPYLITERCAEVIEFLKKAFDAELKYAMTAEDGMIQHAEVKIGDSMIMMANAMETHPPMPTMLHLYLPEVDKYYQRAIAAGATSEREPRDEFYGDRSGGVRDVAGNKWWIATHIEDVNPAEMEERMKAQDAAGA
jgi:PhnB protein